MKKNYESPELDIRWFEMQDIISTSDVYEEGAGDGVVDPGTDW